MIFPVSLDISPDLGRELVCISFNGLNFQFEFVFLFSLGVLESQNDLLNTVDVELLGNLIDDKGEIAVLRFLGIDLSLLGHLLHDIFGDLDIGELVHEG